MIQAQYHCPQHGHIYTSALDIPSLGGIDIFPDPIEQGLIVRLSAMYSNATVEEMSHVHQCLQL